MKIPLLITTLTTTLLVPVAQAQETSWKERAISPVTNPIFFEDPQINSEIRPIFIWHNIDPGFVTGGGDV
ncbi:MAG: hypothetical protein ACK4UN_14645, partial [Limisphaerales bacterium]